jgi:hypothetical protein
VPLFRELSQKRAEAFLNGMDDWLAASEVTSEVETPQALRVGIGVFYCEGPARGSDDAESTVDDG